jgi:hypothetical protein
MTALLIISVISGAGIAFLIYFGFALLTDARRPHGKRVLILKLRERIARKRHQPRLLYVHKLGDFRQPQSERSRRL